ncbi:MAG: HD domain-containing phosphohydrolase [bacterium]
MKMQESIERNFSVPEILNFFDGNLLYHDEEGNILFAAGNLAGDKDDKKETLVGKKCFNILSNKRNRCPGCPIFKVKDTGKKAECVIQTDGDMFYRVKIIPDIQQKTGQIEGFIEIIRDISQLKKEQDELIRNRKNMKKALEKKRILLDNIQTQVWYLTDPETQGEINQARADFLGEDKEELENKSYYEIYSDQDTALSCIEDNRKAFRSKKEIVTNELAVNYNQERRLLSVTKTPHVNEEGEIDFVVCSAHDITDDIEKEERIQYISTHDELTGVYNRTYMSNVIDIIDKKENLPLSIIMGDINGLKMVNDAFGRKKGNEYIKKTAAVIKNSCRSDDIIFRWGGDEFIIIATETSKQEAEIISRRIREKCKEQKVNNIPLSIALGCAQKDSLDQQLDKVIKQAEDHMYRNKLTYSESSRGDIVSTFINTLGEKSNETEEHSMRMGKISLLLGEKLGLSTSELDKLSLLSILHDIGKIAIAEKTLTKQERLTDKEWKKIKKHPEIGYRIVNTSDDFSHIARELLAHHERWDGEGYPQGLKGEEIPLLARIISIVDAYDVMTNGRPYKDPMTTEQAIQELRKCAGGQFDPELTEKFIDLLRENDGNL